jgi:hypothetical protein
VRVPVPHVDGGAVVVSLGLVVCVAMAAAPSESLDDYDDIDLETVCPMTDEEVKRVQAKIKLLGAALPRPPMPQVPTFAATTPSVDKLRRMQRFIESLQYNYTDTTYFSVRKNRPLHQILGTAREVRAARAVGPGAPITPDWAMGGCQVRLASRLTPWRGAGWRGLVLVAACMSVWCDVRADHSRRAAYPLSRGGVSRAAPYAGACFCL